MYRQTPSTFYLLCAVIANFIHLIIAMTTRIIMAGFDNDLTRSSLIFCKARQFIIATYAPLGLTLGSLAVFDQFLVTSRNVRLRRFSNMKNTHRIVVASIIFWHIHSMPFLIYNQIQSNKCVINNEILSIYWSYIHFFGVLLAIPTIALVTFGFLAYKNMRRLANSGQLIGADRQLVTMVCLQLIFVVIATIPFGIYNAYILSTSNTNKSAEQIDQDFLFLTITSLLGLFNFGGSFYVFLAASSRFRQIVRQRLFCCHEKSNKIKPNTIFSIRQI
ncbi:unnamed protein product [Rotaria sp. Silwood2]|nr:unnamed protein product [Rotaria sp. Silwood2]CAF2520184.1 unnamed protein product [Rotaria sp. Silwood2]CAF2919676.1 unnamed protein product [Rotaria sp. Silwood2]CAF3257683.1 unnamed protein product [Rotaria sp. Silwood2]CAF3861961.1 unnamed protein product [Rotaria sp. Silwood2]